MKNLIILFALISSLVLAQQPGWRAIKSTNINVSNAQYVEMFSNSFGNNIILQNTNGSISFYVMNPSTGQAVSGTAIETSGASLANATGDGNKVYVVYKKDNVVKCKYTTNAGANWTAISNLGVNPTSLDAVISDNKIHIAYGLNNAIHYYQYNISTGNWTNYQTVSGTGSWFNPRIEALPSQNKIYVVFGNFDNARSREYNYGNNAWDIIRPLFSSLDYSSVAGFGVDANYIYLYYSRFENEPIPGWHYKFYTRKIQKSNYATVSIKWESHNATQFVQTTQTADNKVHTAWRYYGTLGESYDGYSRYGYESLSLEPGLIHDYFNNGTQDGENIEVNYNFDEYSNIDISSTHNDLHTIWKVPSSNNLKYRQYDTYPANPSNLSLSSHNGHPKLTWNKNPDADIDYYRIYRKKGTGNYTLHTTVSASLSPEYVDNEEIVCNPPKGGHCINETVAKYKISAKDLSGLESGYSNEVEAIIIGEPPSKISTGNSPEIAYNYELSQNYPNPFNPTTNINYQIKEKGFVSLKIFDMLGKEVANLVNETQDEGQYSVLFDASNLPSGVYVYSLRVNDFVQNNKMTLLK